MIFDSHAHYNDRAFDSDRDEVLSSMNKNNVKYIMNACSSLHEMEDILYLCSEYSWIYGAVGIHPESACDCNSDTETAIKKYAQYEKIKAIGEIGLDYYWDTAPREVQRECFDFQLSLADELDMPVIIHDREAHKDSLDIVSSHKGIEGVFHCFSGSREMAREVLDRGLFIALGGSLTFKNNIKTVEVAKYVPLDRLLIETDCPYLTPVPYRGKRNSSVYLPYVIQKIAEIKGISTDEVENATFENAKRLFRIGE